MWTTPKHSCGHEGERVQMYGPMKERTKRLAAMERERCPKCRAAAAQKEAAKSDLPALEGSEKQIAWAADIRPRLLEREEAALAALQAAPCVPEKQAQKTACLLAGEKALKDMRSQTAASWWIDHRDSGIEIFIVWWPRRSSPQKGGARD